MSGVDVLRDSHVIHVTSQIRQILGAIGRKFLLPLTLRRFLLLLQPPPLLPSAVSAQHEECPYLRPAPKIYSLQQSPLRSPMIGIRFWVPPWWHWTRSGSRVLLLRWAHLFFSITRGIMVGGGNTDGPMLDDYYYITKLSAQRKVLAVGMFWFRSVRDY